MESVLLSLILAGVTEWLKEIATAYLFSKAIKLSKDQDSYNDIRKRLTITMLKSFAEPLTIEYNIVPELLSRGRIEEARVTCRNTSGLSAFCSAVLNGVEALAFDQHDHDNRYGIAFLTRDKGVESMSITSTALNAVIKVMKPRVLILEDEKSRLARSLQGALLREDSDMLYFKKLAYLALPGEPDYSLLRISSILGVSYDETPEARAKALLLSSLRLAGILSTMNLCDKASRLIDGLRGLSILCGYTYPFVVRHEIETPPEEVDLLITPQSSNSCLEHVFSPSKINHQRVSSTSIEIPPQLHILTSIALNRGICDAETIARHANLVGVSSAELEKYLNLLTDSWSLTRPLIVQCKDIEVFIASLEEKKEKFNITLVNAGNACGVLAKKDLPEVLGLIHRFTRRLWIRVADSRDIPYNVEIAESAGKKVRVVEGLRETSNLDIARIFSYVYSLASSDSCVLASTRPSMLASLSLGLRIVNRIQDVPSCSNVIVPTIEDLERFAESHGTSLKQALLAIMEMCRGDVYVVSGWSRLPENIVTISLKPSLIDVDIPSNPQIFNSPFEALRGVEQLASEIWGVELRPYQKRIALYMLQPYIRGHGYRKPTIVALLPTGAGKSLIFQSTAALLYKTTKRPVIVISPLIALIEDQIAALEKVGVEACRIDGYVEPTERLECLDRSLKGEVQIVYMTPEQVEKRESKRLISEGLVSYVILDEAHCAIRWGYTFRPSYANVLSFLKRVREEKPWLPIAAFTATFSDNELKKFMRELDVEDYDVVDAREIFDDKIDLSNKPKIVKSTVIRSNLKIEAVRAPYSRKRQTLVELVEVLRQWADEKGSPWVGLIFVPFVRPSRVEESADEIARYLEERIGEKVIVYHGQMNKRERSKILELLRSVYKGEKTAPRIIVATKAFGMGVDIPCIRWIIHYMMSDSIEDYYQEIGRGGRDGKEARCILIYSGRDDFKKRLTLVMREQPRFKIVEGLWRILRRDAKKHHYNRLAYSLIELREELKSSIGLHVSDNDIEKSVHVLSLGGMIDYEITTGIAVECNNGYLLVTNSRKKICITDSSESNGFIDRFLLVTVKEENSTSSKSLVSTIKSIRYDSFAKLIAAFRLSEVLTRYGDKRAKEEISSYFEIGSHRYDDRLMSELRSEVLKLAMSLGISISSIKPNVYQVRIVAKKRTTMNIARGLAFGVFIAMIDSKLVPSDVIVYTEKKFTTLIPRAFKNLVKSLDKKGFIYPSKIKTKSLDKLHTSSQQDMHKFRMIALTSDKYVESKTELLKDSFVIIAS